jgi:hypothetical protein
MIFDFMDEELKKMAIVVSALRALVVTVNGFLQTVLIACCLDAAVFGQFTVLFSEECRNQFSKPFESQRQSSIQRIERTAGAG